MTSYYLTPEAEALRTEALVKRIESEPHPFREDSDFWKLPAKLKFRVAEVAYPIKYADARVYYLTH